MPGCLEGRASTPQHARDGLRHPGAVLIWLGLASRVPGCPGFVVLKEPHEENPQFGGSPRMLSRLTQGTL